MTQRTDHIAIVGAGLAGSLLACDLARLGHKVRLYERRPDPRAQGFIGGRSINLALSTRGITALRRVGLADRILADAIPMPGRIMHADTPGAPTVFQAYSGNPDEAINSVSRSGLNITLLHAADEYDNVELRFAHQCTDLDLEHDEITFQTSDGELVRERPALIVGADGAFSAVRSVLQKSGRFTYSQDYLDHGYKELTIPPTETGPHAPFRLDPGGLHIWPRGAAMMIALPNKDGSFTCTLFWPFDGGHSFNAVDAKDDAGVRTFFERWYPDAVEHMPTLLEDYRDNPTSALVTVRCGPWNHGRVVVLGDAAHAIVPFYGQGMNAAFEDCRVLAEMLERSTEFDTVLPEFFKSRKPNADAIADMALDNFIEMRDKVGSKAFLFKKKAEKVLHRLFPKAFEPLYNMVSFSNVPYAEARRRAAASWKRVANVGGFLAYAVVAGALLLLTTLGWWAIGITALVAGWLTHITLRKALVPHWK